MIDFIGLRVKIFDYLIHDVSEDKKAKDAKKCVIRRKSTFENYKNCSVATHLKNKMNHLQKKKKKKKITKKQKKKKKKKKMTKILLKKIIYNKKQ